MTEIEDVQRYITDCVTKRWADASSAFLLSALGPMIKKEFESFDIKEHGGLRKLCEGMATVKIVRHPDSQPRIGAIPSDAQFSGDVRCLFDEVKHAASGPVYHDEFWKAFTRWNPSRRFVNVYHDDAFEICETSSSNAKVSYEILESDIPLTTNAMTIPQKVLVTHEKIDAWLDRNQIKDAGGVFGKRRFELSSSAKIGGFNDLLNALSILNEEELRRISLPADIILKLSGRR